MFYGLSNIITINFSKIDSSKIINTEYMFGNCNVSNIYFNDFDTSNVINIKRMFYLTLKLFTLDISKFNTSSVRDMSEMFRYCKVMKLNLNNFDQYYFQFLP